MRSMAGQFGGPAGSGIAGAQIIKPQTDGYATRESGGGEEGDPREIARAEVIKHEQR